MQICCLIFKFHLVLDFYVIRHLRLSLNVLHIHDVPVVIDLAPLKGIALGVFS